MGSTQTLSQLIDKPLSLDSAGKFYQILSGVQCHEEVFLFFFFSSMLVRFQQPIQDYTTVTGNLPNDPRRDDREESRISK